MNIFKQFNLTHLEHTVIAIAMQLLLWPIFGMGIATAVPIVWFFAREFTQNEYKYAIKEKDWKWGDKLPIKGHEGLIYGWSPDSFLDTAVPAIFNMTIFYAWLSLQ